MTVPDGNEVSEVTSFADGGPYDRFCFLSNPDGNKWAVQDGPAAA